jgi:ketosteroid isomerase-like protein
MLGPGGSRMGKAAAAKMISGVKCDVKVGWEFEEPYLSAIDLDTYVLSYKGVFDGTCTVDGKPGKLPSPIRAATVWIRSGDKWLAAFHGENVIVNPEAPPAAPVGKNDESKNDDAASANAKPAAPVADPTTDALTSIERAVWEAWRSRDAAKLEELTAGEVAFVDIFGNVTAGKTNTIKFWTEHECDVKSVSVSDGVGTSLSPTVSILTFKGTADGTCSGQKLDGPIYGTSVYVNNGGTWKLAFTFNSPD